MMHAPIPQKEHQWLDKLVGEWNSEHDAVMEPGKPPVKFTGTETFRSLGGLWFLGEGRGETPGGSIGISVMTLGYDPARKRYLGTFIHSMMTHMWIYDGALNQAGTILTLDTDGPSFTAEGKMAKYQDIIEFISDDHRTLTAQVLGEDGKWNHFMTVHYRRVK